MRKPLTGEPCAGKPHARFGGRGGLGLLYPYQKSEPLHSVQNFKGPDHHPGRVNSSSRISQVRACAPPSSTAPHISTDACSCPHTAGRSGCPKILQRSCSSSCTQGTPAGLPCGMPGMGEVMEGAVQQAAQPGRQVRVIRSKASGSARPQGPQLQGLLQAARQFASGRAGACVIVGPHGAHDGGSGVLGQHHPVK